MTTTADAPAILRIGCLGAARITPDVIVRPAQARGDVTLAAVAGRDRARTELFATEHGFERVCANYDELIQRPDVDLVYNPLPVNLHALWSIRALEAGKHVLCEKPFAMNLAEAKTVLDASRANGRRVIEGIHACYHPAFIQCANWVRSGAIGQVRSMQGILTVAIPDNGGMEIRHLPETGGGAFMDLGVYPLSCVLAMTDDDPNEVEANARLTSRGVDERMEVALTFPGDIKAQLLTSMEMTAPTHTSFEVIGETGRILFENPSIPQRGYRLRLFRNDGTIDEAPIDRVGTYFYQMDALVRGLVGGDPLPTEGASILRQQSIIDSVYAAAGLSNLRSEQSDR
jgi:predicted dehydrogenase